LLDRLRPCGREIPDIAGLTRCMRKQKANGKAIFDKSFMTFRSRRGVR